MADIEKQPQESVEVATPSCSSPTEATTQDNSVQQKHQFNEQTNYLPRARVIAIFLVCATIDFLTLMDQTTLAASLAIVSSKLNAGSKASWIAGGFFITSTSFQLLYGRLSDIWSRKYIIYVGFAIFFFGSLASSLATSADQLIAFRAVTGVGGGGLMTIAQAIVSDVVSLRERGKYQGIFGVFVALANGVGPVIGGALSEHDWRWIFRLNLPLSAVTILGVIFFMPLKKVEGDWKRKIKAIDFVGCFVALGASTLLVLAFTWAGGEKAWNSAAVIAPLVIGVALCGVFALWEWKAAPLPLVPLHIFKSRVVNGATLTMFVNGWNFVTQVYYIPTFYQLVYGYSPTKSAALLIPITVTQTIFSTVSGLIVHWRGRYRESILLGWISWSIGLGLFATLDENSGIGKQIGYAILTGFGVGQTLQPSLIAIQAGVPRKDMAIVTSWRNFIRNFGATLGLAIAGTVLNNHIRSALASIADLSSQQVTYLLNDPASVTSGTGTLPGTNIPTSSFREAFTDAYKAGFRTIFIIGASLSAAAFFVALVLLPHVDLHRPDDQKLKAEGKKFDDALKQKREDRKGQMAVKQASETSSEAEVVTDAAVQEKKEYAKAA